MTNATDQARMLMVASAIHGGIQHADHSAELAAWLSLVADDSTEYTEGHRTVREYWGIDDDGDEWRIHLTECAD